MTELSAIKDLIGDEEDDPFMRDIANILSKQLGREVKVGKKKVILHPKDMWKDEEGE